MSCDLFHSLKIIVTQVDGFSIISKKNAKKYYCIVFWPPRLYGVLQRFLL